MQSNWFIAISTADFSVHWESDIVGESPCDSFHFKLQINCPFWVLGLFLRLHFKCLSGKFVLNLMLTVPSLSFLPLSLCSLLFFFFFNTSSLRNHIIWRAPKFTVLHSSLSWLSTQISPSYSCSNTSHIHSFPLKGCQNRQLLPFEYCEDPLSYLSKRGRKDFISKP